MDRDHTEPRTLTLREVLEGAERAAKRVAAWPEWKRALSDPKPLEPDEDPRGADPETSSG